MFGWVGLPVAGATIRLSSTKLDENKNALFQAAGRKGYDPMI